MYRKLINCTFNYGSIQIMPNLLDSCQWRICNKYLSSKSSACLFVFLKMPKRGPWELWMLSTWFISQWLVWITCVCKVKTFTNFKSCVSGKNTLAFHTKSSNISELVWNIIKCTVHGLGKMFWQSYRLLSIIWQCTQFLNIWLRSV